MASRVAIIEDDEPLLDLWCRYIGRKREFRLHHSFAKAEDALPVLLGDPPDILVADWKLAGQITGIDLVAQLKTKHPKLLAIVVSGYPLADLPPDALLAGADGFLRKPISAHELIDSLRRVLAGHCPFSQPVVALLRERLRQRAAQSPLPVGPLSSQEHRVLERLALGHSGKQVADELGLAWGTFLTYRSRAFEKLGAHSLTDALRRLQAKSNQTT